MGLDKKRIPRNSRKKTNQHELKFFTGTYVKWPYIHPLSNTRPLPRFDQSFAMFWHGVFSGGQTDMTKQSKSGNNATYTSSFVHLHLISSSEPRRVTKHKSDPQPTDRKENNEHRHSTDTGLGFDSN